jgi:nitrate reductase gamma subunit
MTTTTDRKATWVREELLQLLSVSGTLAGLAITGVAMFRSLGRETMSTTIADDLLFLLGLSVMVASGFIMVYSVL